VTYDPQANRQRPKPKPDEAAPVDALIGTPVSDDPEPSSSPTTKSPATETLSPGPRVAPKPADPVPDSIVAGTGVLAVVGALIGLLGLRYFWRRFRHSGMTHSSPD
jgi:hypothetical protein